MTPSPLMSTVNDDAPTPPVPSLAVTPDKLRLILGLLLILVTFAVFQHAPTFDFVDLDDRQNVFENPYYLPATLAKLAALWRAPYYHLYSPVTYTLWAFCARLAYLPEGAPRLSGGVTHLAPSIFHTADLLLHLVNVLLVFGLLDRFTRRPLAAAAGALLFGIHPLQVEAVCWVTGTNNTLAALFGLLALRAYVAAADAGMKRRRALLLTAATGAYALALLSKPTAVAVPLVAAVLEAGFLCRAARSWLPLLLAWVGLALLCVAATQYAAALPPGTIYLPLWGRPFIVGDSLAFYLGRLALPLRLGFDYGHAPRAVLHAAWGYLAWLVPAGLALLLWRLRQRQILIAFGVFVAGALPMLGAAPTYFQTLSTVADRYVYLALLGPALAAAWLLRSASARTIGFVVAPLAAVLGVLSFRQAETWRTTRSLFTQAIAVNPNSGYAYAGLATALCQAGDIDGAIAAARRSLEMQPMQYQASLTLGTLLLWKGQHVEAAPYIARAARLEPPGEVEPRVLVGTQFLLEGKTEEARREFAAAVRINPDDPNAHRLLGAAYERSGNKDEAAAEYAAALRLRPDFALARAGLARVTATPLAPSSTAPYSRRPR